MGSTIFLNKNFLGLIPGSWESCLGSWESTGQSWGRDRHGSISSGLEDSSVNQPHAETFAKTVAEHPWQTSV